MVNQKHITPKIFITGIPTAGKSYVAKKIVKETGGFCLETDNLREELAKDPAYEKWATFFEKQDEYAYYTENDPNEQWRILSDMHETLWPGVVKKIREYENGNIPLKSKLAAFMRKPSSKTRPLVFEGINLLPRLAKRDLDFPGIVLVGKSLEEVRQRNQEKPRWGQTEKMMEMSARAFWFIERPQYISEAKKYGYPIFEDADEAYEKALELLRLR